MVRLLTTSVWEVVTYLLTLAFAAISITFGSYDPWWKVLGLPDSFRVPFSSAISVFFLLAGHTIAALIREARSLNEMRFEATDIERRLRNSIPFINSLWVLDTADEGFRYLTDVLPLAIIAKNTRFTLVEAGKYVTSAGKMYEQMVLESIRGGLSFKDVICPLFADSARMLQSKTQKSSGFYDCVVSKEVPSAFANFIVLTYKDGRKEVILGWAITKSSGFEQKCIRISDVRVAEYFEQIHADLVREGILLKDWPSISSK